MLFLIITVIVLNCVAFFISKRISGIEIFATTLFSSFLEVMANVYLDLKYDLYGYFDKGVSWGTLLYIFGIFPAVNITFLNYFPYDKKVGKKWLYIAGCSVFAVIFEFLFLWSRTFYYNGWKLWYSAILYPFLFLSLYWCLKYVRHLLRKG